MPRYPITVFYDGACRLCIGQVESFKKKDKEKNLVFVDISRPDFDAKKFGLQSEPIQKYIYAKDRGGELVRGIDVFRSVWQATGRGLLAFLVGLPVVKELGKLLYGIVSRSRYKLSGGKSAVCDFHCAKKV